MTTEEPTRLAALTWPVEHGLLFVCSTDGPGDHTGMGPAELVHALPQSLAVAVRHYVDGDANVEVWDGPAPHAPDSVVFQGRLELDGGAVLVTDTEDRLRMVFPVAGDQSIVLRVDSRESVGHLVIEIHGG